MKYSLCFCYYDRYFCVSSVYEQKSSNALLMTYNPTVSACISNLPLVLMVATISGWTGDPLQPRS